MAARPPGRGADDRGCGRDRWAARTVAGDAIELPRRAHIRVFGVAWFVTKAHRLVLVSTDRAVSASRRRLERVETTRLQKLSSSPKHSPMSLATTPELLAHLGHRRLGQQATTLIAKGVLDVTHRQTARQHLDRQA